MMRTSSRCLAHAILGIASGCAANVVVVEDFRQSSHSWRVKNDPVMGGKSHASFAIENGVAIFDGEVVNVPFLQVPGFVTMETSDGVYPDISSCTGFSVTARSSQSFRGYRFSFGNVHIPGGRFAFGYKANFDPPVGDSFVDVEIPFTDFSAKWDDATGDQIVTCYEDQQYCPTIEALRNLKTMSVWGEGVAGKVHIEILAIKAIGCAEYLRQSALELHDISSEQDEIDIESFDNVRHKWGCLNDPVMGGDSKGSITLHDGVASFDGKVAIVPFLQAPGFITMRSVGGAFPDVSSCTALKLVLMATVQYDGFRISFGTHRLPNLHHGSGYKANFNAPLGSFDEVVLPFANFSSYWDEATGNQIVTCAENSTYCPDLKTLKNMSTMSIWAEGISGDVQLFIKSISAVGCGSKTRIDFGDQLSMSPSNDGLSGPYARAFSFGAAVAILGVVITFFLLRRRRWTYNLVSEVS